MELQQLLLWSGVIAGPIFIIVFLVEGMLRPDYDPREQPVSALSQGPRGWIQITSFIVVGVLITAYSFGLFSATSSFWGPLLVTIDGMALIGAGIFVTDASIAPRPERLLRGILHDLFSLVVFVSITIACLVFAALFAHAGARIWELYSIASGVLYGGGFLMFARGFAHRRHGIIASGILQRITIVIGLLWLSLLGLYMLFV